MPLSKRLIGFNQQLLFGEIGSLIGTPLAPWVTTHFTAEPGLISLSAVLGGLVTGSAFWLIIKIRAEHKPGTNPVRHLAGQIALFTPAALVMGAIAYQPTLFLVSRHLIASGHRVVLAAIVAQFAAFSLFLIAMNLYRAALLRFTGKHL